MTRKATIPQQLRRQVQDDFAGRCAFCRSPETLMAVFYEVDHILPEVRGGSTFRTNLALTCPICNRYKGAKTRGRDPVTGRRVPLFNPRRQGWFRHFAWSSDGLTIYGRTVSRRAAVDALRLNNERLVRLRALWLLVDYAPPNWS